MFEETLQQLIQLEIEKGIEEFRKEFRKTKKSLSQYKEKLEKAELELKDFRTHYKKLENLKVLINSINSDNIESVIGMVNLRSRKISFTGMNSEEIPTWFKLLCTYYDDKERLFSILDVFDIEYPYWAKTFKMPYDYNEDELDLIFDNLGKMYVCNGQIFNGNMGFFWQYQRKFKGNLKELFSKESYVEIPWNLFLQNPLLITDKYFKRITSGIIKNTSRSEYFYMIQNYQELLYEQSNELASILPDRMLEYHKAFIEKNQNLLQQRTDLAAKFINNITDNKFSTFYYLKYPIEAQKNYIKSYKGHYDSKFKLVQYMSIPKTEKIALLMEVADLELSK